MADTLISPHALFLITMSTSFLGYVTNKMIFQKDLSQTRTGVLTYAFIWILIIFNLLSSSTISKTIVIIRQKMQVKHRSLFCQAHRTFCYKVAKSHFSIECLSFVSQVFFRRKFY